MLTLYVVSRVPHMRSTWLVALSLVAILFVLIVPRAAAQSDASLFFELHGKVVNALTGEPVGGALVQVNQYAGFSDSDGSFTFSGIPRGRYSVVARKPGYFNERELGRWIVPDVFADVPSDAPLLVKLAPEAILYGEVKDRDGEALSNVTVVAKRWQTVNGRRQLEDNRQTVTDDQGAFRLAELPPGKYFLAFLPPGSGGIIRRGIRQRRGPDEGFGVQFYPGVPEVSAATPFALRAGDQVHVAQVYQRQQLFQISGAIRGVPANEAFTVTLVNSTGQALQRDVRISPKTGEFQVVGVPAGAYLIRATVFPARFVRDDPRRLATASQIVQVSRDVSGIVLVAGSGASVGVQLHDELTAPPAQPRQVFIRLIPKEFAQGGPALLFPPPAQDRLAPSRFEDLAPGLYTVEASAPQGYIAALHSGSADLLRDDLVVPPGASPPPIDVTLRDDVAQLTIRLNQMKSDGLLIYSREYPHRSLLVPVQPGTASVTQSLPPGNYELIALANASDLEYQNPAAIARFLGRAVSVNLQPHDSSTIALDVQDFAEEPQ